MNLSNSFSSLTVENNRYPDFGNNKRPSNRCCIFTCPLVCVSKKSTVLDNRKFVNNKIKFFLTFFVSGIFKPKTAFDCEWRFIPVRGFRCKVFLKKNQIFLKKLPFSP